MRTLDHTRVTIAAQAVGVAQGALDYALDYAEERTQFGKPIADFQGLQFMLADMGMKIEAARSSADVRRCRPVQARRRGTFFVRVGGPFSPTLAVDDTSQGAAVVSG